MQRVKTKKSSDEGAAQTRSSSAKKKKEYEKRVATMNSDIDQMVFAGGQAEELAIHHVRNPSQRVPIPCVRRTERPFQGFPGQPLLNMLVVRHICRIVIA